MSVRRDADGTVALDGACAAADAEDLLQRLLADPQATVDWQGCTQLHTAVLQVLLAINPPIRGPCGVPFVERWFSLPIGRNPVRRAPGPTNFGAAG